MTPLGNLVRDHARHRGGDEALVMGATRVTYAELDARANRIAAGLRARGLTTGDRVAVLARHAIDYVSLYFATAKAGLVLAPLSYWHRLAEQAYVLDDCRPSLAVVEEEFADSVRELLAARGVPVVVVRGTDDDPGSSSPPWSELYGVRADAANGPDAPVLAGSGDLPHMVLYTSGTTGRPKGALLAQERTVRNAFSMALAMRLRPDDIYIDCFRTFHSGSWDHLKLYFLTGATVVLVRDFDAGLVLDAIARERVTVLLTGGPMLRFMLDHESFPLRDLSTLRLIYGGAYDDGTGVMADAAHALHERCPQLQIAACYGLTEAGPFVTYCPPDEVPRAPKSVGRPVPGVRVELLDDDGTPVRRGEPGEVCVGGPRFSGYLNQPDASREAIVHDMLRTGDVAIEDDGGYLTIVDRKKDMIRTGAHNVFSLEVEIALVTHPEVAEAAVIGLPDRTYGEVVAAVVVPAAAAPVRAAASPSAESDAWADELRAYMRERAAGYNVPTHVFLVDELPRNANGKVLKVELRAQYTDHA